MPSALVIVFVVLAWLLLRKPADASAAAPAPADVAYGMKAASDAASKAASEAGAEIKAGFLKYEPKWFPMVPTSWLLEMWLNFETWPNSNPPPGSKEALGGEIQKRIGPGGTEKDYGWNANVDGLVAKRAFCFFYFGQVQAPPGFLPYI